MGSPRFRSTTTAGCVATEAWFPPGAVLSAHTHDRSIFAVMLEGSFETVIGTRTLGCLPHSIWTEPCEERHANYVGTMGARVLVLQPDWKRADLFAPFHRLLGEVSHVRDPMVSLDARRLVAELDIRDALTPLSIDGLVLTMLASAERRTQRERSAQAPPPWLRRIRDLIHDRFRERLDVAELAGAADVTPSHLCQAFRRHYAATIGEYTRRLRLAWATDRLVDTDEPISAIAAAGGYSDQSHLTRECRRVMGAGPAELRRRRRP